MRRMQSLLIINPNTTPAVSALLEASAARDAPRVQARVDTARFGAPYIGCEASYAIAAHAVLDAWALAAAGTPPHAVLVGCFGDPGLFALRDAGVPATGLASAAAAEAARHGGFAIVTGGRRWEPMLRRLMNGLEEGASCRGILALEAGGLQLARDPGARGLLAQACRDAVRRFDAKAVVIGGAALAGMAQAIQPQVGVPLVDSVAAGMREAARLAGAAGDQPATRADEIRPWLAAPPGPPARA
jgi:allantoin racemase